MNPPLDINLQSKMPLKDSQPWCSKILVPQTHSAPSFSHLILLSPPGPRIPSSKMPRLVLMLQPIFPFPPSNFIFFFPICFLFLFFHTSQSSTILKSPMKQQCYFVVLPSNQSRQFPPSQCSTFFFQPSNPPKLLFIKISNLPHSVLYDSKIPQ